MVISQRKDCSINCCWTWVFWLVATSQSNTRASYLQALVLTKCKFFYNFFYPHDFWNQTWRDTTLITWIYHVTFIAIHGGTYFFFASLYRTRGDSEHKHTSAASFPKVHRFSSSLRSAVRFFPQQAPPSCPRTFPSCTRCCQRCLFSCRVNNNKKGTLCDTARKQDCSRRSPVRDCYRGDVLWVKFNKMTSVFKSMRLSCVWSWISSWHCPPLLVAS